MIQIIQKAIFVIRFRFLIDLSSTVRKLFFSCCGMHIGSNTKIRKIYVTWPNQVFLGKNCILETGVYFKFDGIWRAGKSINVGNNVFIGTNCEFNINEKITIGNDCLIASGTRFIDHDHGMAKNILMREQPSTKKEIIIGNDVWIGCNVVILKGVVIGNGAIVAAGAVVTKSIDQNEVWGGIPAKKISMRTE